MKTKKLYKLSNKKLKYRIKNYTKINKLKGGSSICNLISKLQINSKKALNFTIPNPAAVSATVVSVNKEANTNTNKNEKDDTAKVEISLGKIKIIIPHDRKIITTHMESGKPKLLTLIQSKKNEMFRDISKYKIINYNDLSKKENNTSKYRHEIIMIKDNYLILLLFFACIKAPSKKKIDPKWESPEDEILLKLQNEKTELMKLQIKKKKKLLKDINYKMFGIIEENFKPFISDTERNSILKLIDMLKDSKKQLYKYEIIGLSHYETYKMCEIILDMYNKLNPNIENIEKQEWSKIKINLFINYSKKMDEIIKQLNEAFSREVEYVYQ